MTHSPFHVPRVVPPPKQVQPLDSPQQQVKPRVPQVISPPKRDQLLDSPQQQVKPHVPRVVSPPKQDQSHVVYPQQFQDDSIVLPPTCGIFQHSVSLQVPHPVCCVHSLHIHKCDICSKELWPRLRLKSKTAENVDPESDVADDAESDIADDAESDVADYAESDVAESDVAMSICEDEVMLCSDDKVML